MKLTVTDTGAVTRILQNLAKHVKALNSKRVGTSRYIKMAQAHQRIWLWCQSVLIALKS